MSLAIYLVIYLSIAAATLLLVIRFFFPRGHLFARVAKAAPVAIGLEIGALILINERTGGVGYAYFNYLCEHEAVDKVNARAQNVEGLARLTPVQLSQYNQMSDRWSRRNSYAYLAREGTDVFLDYVEPHYQFIEFENDGIGAGADIKAPWLSEEPKLTGRKVPRNPNLGPKYDPTEVPEWRPVLVGKSDPRSEFGYRTTDDSTILMKLLWISRGRLQVVDRKSDQILAERIGFSYDPPGRALTEIVIGKKVEAKGAVSIGEGRWKTPLCPSGNGGSSIPAFVMNILDPVKK